jgi:very-short-patch-repair endonuclease/predicted transcriptional regulator of viral defense system
MHHRLVRGMRDRTATETIRRLAEDQYGLVTRDQLLRLGLRPRLIEARVGAGFLVRVHEGVFAVGHGLLGREATWLAAVLACGRGTVLSHASAVALWGIGGDSERVEVTRRAGGTKRSGIWLHQSRFLPDDHVTVERGIPVTAVERTILDMAARMGWRDLERMVVKADRARLLDWQQLHRVVDCGNGKKGSGRLKSVVLDIDPSLRDTRSLLEADLLTLCRKAGLPRPEVNVLVEGFLVDFLWREPRLVVETDGYAYHSDRGAFERDRERDLALTAAGYEVGRFTYRMLSRQPEACAGRIREALRRRGASRMPLGARQP